MIATLSSVDAPSIIMYSKSVNVCEITPSMVFSRPFELFLLIVMIDSLGIFEEL
jgi:hypothetical protein